MDMGVIWTGNFSGDTHRVHRELKNQLSYVHDHNGLFIFPKYNLVSFILEPEQDVISSKKFEYHINNKKNNTYIHF